MEMLEERSALLDRNDETHDASESPMIHSAIEICALDSALLRLLCCPVE